jgi:restriction endonuclease BglII
MYRLHLLSYRYADAVLQHPEFGAARDEIFTILKAAPLPLLDPDNPNPRAGGVKYRRRDALKGGKGDRYFFLPVDQKKLNEHLDAAFEHAGWQPQPTVVDPSSGKGPDTGLKADFKKGRLQIEIQFGNMARWYTDVFKFQLSYALDLIDVGVLVVPMQAFANMIDENVAYYERVARELPWAKMSLTLPILVIGVEPESYSGVEACYAKAAANLVSRHEAEGKHAVAIPFKEQEQVEAETPE